ncbi:hypothetical protein EMCRGX_G013927 [Ephydatia muelleri]
MYFREAKVPDNKRGEELVALLEDDAFRVVSQSGFVSGDGVEYEEVKKCLQEQYAPKGVELEWQRKLHSAHQERPETLLEFSGPLRMLADKAYPSWSAERRLEMAQSLEAALDLASQWESVELAQQSLRGEKQGSGASLAVSGERDLVQGALRANTVEELALQVQQLSQEIRKLSSREVGEKRSAPKRVPVCWNCKQKGHIRRNCPQRKERSVSPKEIGKDRKPKKIFYFSDGCAAQYKNRKNFINLCHHAEDFNVLAEWHFFATSHGKTAADSVAGTLKRMAAKASLQRPNEDQILNAKKLYEFASNEIAGMSFCFVTNEEHNEEEKILQARFLKSKTLPGTQKYHCFKPLNTTMVEVKQYSAAEQKYNKRKMKNATS